MTLALIAHGDKIQIEKQLVTIAGFLEQDDLNEKKRLVILCDSDDEIVSLPEGLAEVVLLPVKDTNIIASSLNALEDYFNHHPHSLLLFGSDDRSRQLAVRLAYRLAGSSCLGVREIKMSLEPATVIKGIYSNNASGRIQLEKEPYCVSVEKTFKGSLVLNTRPLLRYPVAVDENIKIDYYRKYKDLQDRLEDEDQVVIIGNGVEKKDLASIQDLAKKMGAGLGGTRSAVERGLVSIEKLVGISGKIIAPTLCLLIGVSGMAALTGGIEGSQRVIAINNNPDAPIFRFAHDGIVKPYQEILPKLLSIYNDEENNSG